MKLILHKTLAPLALCLCVSFLGCKHDGSAHVYISSPAHDRGYFPLTVGAKWTYREADAKDGWAGEPIGNFIDSERQQGATTVFSQFGDDTYQLSAQGIVRLYVRNFFDGKRYIVTGPVILSFPLSKGKTWTYENILGDGLDTVLVDKDDLFEVKSIGKSCHTRFDSYSDCLVIEDKETSPITGHTIGLDGIHAVGGDSSLVIRTYAYGVGPVKTETYKMKKGWFSNRWDLVSSSELTSFHVDIDQAKKSALLYQEYDCNPDHECIPPPPPRPTACNGKVKCDPPPEHP